MIRRSAFVLLTLVLCTLASAATLEREIPAEAEQGDMVTVRLILMDAREGQRVVIGDRIPPGALFLDWDVTGEIDGSALYTKDGDELIWEFLAAGDTAEVMYTVLLPQDGAQARFDAVFAAAPDDYGREVALVTLLTPPAVEAPAPVDVMPSPAQLPIPQHTSELLLLVVLIGVLLGSGGFYLNTRLKEAHLHPQHHVMVSQVVAQFMRMWAAIVHRKVVLPLRDAAQLQHISAAQAAVLEDLPVQQKRMIAVVERIEDRLPYGSPHLTQTEALKEELRNISFSYRTPGA